MNESNFNREDALCANCNTIFYLDEGPQCPDCGSDEYDYNNKHWRSGQHIPYQVKIMSVKFNIHIEIDIDDIDYRYTLKNQIKDYLEEKKDMEGIGTMKSFLENIRIRL